MWLTESQIGEFQRSEIAVRATDLAREALPGLDIEILWDEMWVRRVGAGLLPRSRAVPDGRAEVAALGAAWRRNTCATPTITGSTSTNRARATRLWMSAPAAARMSLPFRAPWEPAGESSPSSRIRSPFRRLRKFCQLNRLANVTALNYACVDRPAHLQIETLPVWESNYVREGDPSTASYAVEGVTLDSLLAVEQIDFLKMNIEGAERSALPGCRETLARTRFACIAAHDFRAARGEGEHFRTLEFVRRFLTDAGFTITTRDADPRYYVPYHVHGRREP